MGHPLALTDYVHYLQRPEHLQELTKKEYRIYLWELDWKQRKVEWDKNRDRRVYVDKLAKQDFEKRSNKMIKKVDIVIECLSDGMFTASVKGRELSAAHGVTEERAIENLKFNLIPDVVVEKKELTIEIPFN